MKRLLLLAFASILYTTASAQCAADEYDFGDAGFGVSPDPENGENFDTGYLNVAYSDVIYVKIPSNASDIDPNFPEQIPVDSVLFVGVEFILDGTTYTPEQIGLEVVCNNQGDSDNECMFLGGQQYCAVLQGTPTVAGVFNMNINIEAYAFFVQLITQQMTFDQYTFVVESEVSVADVPATTTGLDQNIPNPADDRTTINYQMANVGKATLRVVNLLGEIVYEDAVMAKAGNNSWKLETAELQNGLYLYSIEAGGKKLTKRMVVNR